MLMLLHARFSLFAAFTFLQGASSLHLQTYLTTTFICMYIFTACHCRVRCHTLSTLKCILPPDIVSWLVRDVFRYGLVFFHSFLYPLFFLFFTRSKCWCIVFIIIFFYFCLFVFIHCYCIYLQILLVASSW